MQGVPRDSARRRDTAVTNCNCSMSRHARSASRFGIRQSLAHSITLPCMAHSMYSIYASVLPCKPSTLNSQLSTLNPQPSTLNPLPIPCPPRHGAWPLEDVVARGQGGGPETRNQTDEEHNPRHAFQPLLGLEADVEHSLCGMPPRLFIGFGLPQGLAERVRRVGLGSWVGV
jgi:hypothetical protein